MPRATAAIEAAKADGRWEAAYDSPSRATVPEDFLALLRKNKKALQFFETLNKVNRYAIAYRSDREETGNKTETSGNDSGNAGARDCH